MSSSASQGVARSAAGVALATFGSRILGYVRDMLVAAYLGTGPVADAWVVAYQIPNLFRRLFGEGALQASFVPVFVGLRQQSGEDEGWRLVCAMAAVLAAVLTGCVALGELLAPALVRIMVPGFAADPEKMQLTVRLLRVTLPYLWLVSLAALAMGILNGVRHFAMPALAPILLNLAFIGYLGVLAPRWAGEDTPRLALGLGVAVLVGGALQLAALAATAAAKGLHVVPTLWHPQVGTVIRRMAPAALGMAVYQVNVLVDKLCASFSGIVGEGAVSALYYGFRLMALPLGLFAIAIATTVFPTLASAASEDDREGFRTSLGDAMRWALALTVPSAVGLAVLRYPIVRLIFERGAFGTASVDSVTQTVLFYSIGLAGYSGVHILSRAFYSIGDTRTPVRAACWALGANMALNVALMWPLRVGGLALATSLTATLNAGILAVRLRRQMGPLGYGALARSGGRTAAAAAAMGLVCWAAARGVGALGLPEGLPNSLAATAIPIALGVASYLGALRLLGGTEVAEMATAIRRR